MEKDEILKFVREMKPREHVVMFHSGFEDKHRVLFTYLKAGLDQGEVAAYVASEETPDEVRQAMRRFGIDADRLEGSEALRVMNYTDCYTVGGKLSVAETLDRWKRLHDEAVAKGFRGLRATGETACFFRERMVRKLVEYEQALHRVLELPMAAICAYDSSLGQLDRDSQHVYSAGLRAVHALCAASLQGEGIDGLPNVVDWKSPSRRIARGFDPMRQYPPDALL